MTKKDEKQIIHKAIDGEVSQSETRRLKRTLAEDGHARAEFEQLKRIVEESGHIRVDVPPDFKGKVMKGVTGPRHPPKRG